jgi:hypothetical protein
MERILAALAGDVTASSGAAVWVGPHCRPQTIRLPDE